MLSSAYDENNRLFAKGRLTIKGITNEIVFPVSFNNENDEITLSSLLVFDRTKYNIKYKSKTIFPELGNKFIHDEVEVHVKIKLTRLAQQ